MRGILLSLAGLALIPAAGIAAADDAPPPPAFSATCAMCHGERGEGLAGPTLRPLAIPPGDVAGIVRSGSGQMPAIPRDQLSDADLATIADWLARP